MLVQFKEYFIKNFEQLMVLFILLSVIVLNYLIDQKLALLNLFYLPVLVAGFILGKKKAVLTSILSIASVSFYVIMYPQSYKPTQNILSLVITLISWGSFLTLSSIIVGYLHEENEIKYHQLRTAYIGILEILSKYIESADKYTQGHSVRVSQYATDIALSMKLSARDVENIKVAALLHDVGKVEVSGELIRKAAELTKDEKSMMASHTEKGAQLLSSVGDVLREAVPLVLAHHEYFSPEENRETATDVPPLGARIIAVADSYDAMVTDRPYRAGMSVWKAIEELDRCTGTQFDPDVVKHFKHVLSQQDGYRQILPESDAENVIQFSS
jgi:putative nucleotidyltransferase with HDIG domain